MFSFLVQLGFTIEAFEAILWAVLMWRRGGSGSLALFTLFLGFILAIMSFWMIERRQTRLGFPMGILLVDIGVLTGLFFLLGFMFVMTIPW